MSRMYHPDKHAAEEMKSKAETLFNKIKKAHEGLHFQLVHFYDISGVEFWLYHNHLSASRCMYIHYHVWFIIIIIIRRVSNSPGLTQSLWVSAFDLQAPGVALQSLGY